MILKFIAGLTKFEEFPEGTIHGVLRCFISLLAPFKLNEVLGLDLSRIRASCSRYDIELEDLHYLYEAKARMSLLNTLAEVNFIEYFLGRLSPFDYYIMGYVVSHTSCQWNIALGPDEVLLEEHGDHEIQAAMIAKGINEDEALYPVSASTVSINISLPMKATDIKHFLDANPSFLNRITHFRLLIKHFDNALITLFLHNLQLLPQLKSLYLNAYSVNVNCSLETSRQTPSSLTLLFRKLKDRNLKCFGLCNIVLSYAPCRIFELPECQALAQWLSSPSCSLEELDIGGNHLRCEFTRVLVLSLCQNCSLHSLNLSTSQIPRDLLARLIHLPLTRLWLKNCEIDEEGVVEIASALCNNANLKELNLSGNDFRDVGATALAAALQHNVSLENVYLVLCIDSKGIACIMQALCHNNVLKTLDISENFMRERDVHYVEAIQAMSDMLEQNTALLDLDLRSTLPKYEGIQPLLRSLERNATLKTLRLDKMQPQTSSHDKRIIWARKMI